MILEREWQLKLEESLLRTFGHRLRHARVTGGYDTQESFRRALRSVGVDVGNSMITELEKDRAKPSYDVLVGMAKVLHRSLDWLCCLPETMNLQPPEEPIYSDDALDVARKVDSLPPEIKSVVIDEILRLLQRRYDEYDSKREFTRLVALVSERGDPSILDSLRKIMKLKAVSNGVQ